MTVFEEIARVLKGKKWAAYKIAGEKAEVSISAGPASIIDDGESYFLMPLIDDSSNHRAVGQFIVEHCLGVPELVIVSPVVIDHYFGEAEAVDHTVLNPGDSVIIVSFRVERDRIVVISEMVDFEISATEFLEGIKNLPDLTPLRG